jgi:hypothetical protein
MIINMATWTYNDIEGALEHITLREKYRDGILASRQLIAHEGYAIYNTTEELYTDPETGETYPPTYSYQASLPLSVDYTIYAAAPITPGMEVVGGTPGTEIA